MQKTFLLSVLLWISPVLGQTTEQKVLEGVQKMMRTQQEVIFSELYNDDRFSSEEKDFLGRLYEIFFSDSSFSQIGTRDHRLDPDSPANLDGLRHQSAVGGSAAGRDADRSANALSISTQHRNRRDRIT